MKRKSRGLNPKRFLALFCALTVVLSSYTPVYADGEENPPAETVQEVPSEMMIADAVMIMKLKKLLE